MREREEPSFEEREKNSSTTRKGETHINAVNRAGSALEKRRYYNQTFLRGDLNQRNLETCLLTFFPVRDFAGNHFSGFCFTPFYTLLAAIALAQN